MAMTPDIHNLKDYQFWFIHQRMRMIAQEDGYTFIDLLPAFGELPPERVWAVLTDFDSYPKWNPFIHSISGDLRVGGHLIVRIVPPGGSLL